MSKGSDKAKGLTYEDSGVSIDTMDAGLMDVADIVKSTYRKEVLSHQGQFGGLFALNKEKYDEPVLVSSTDSVGTKLKVAFMLNKHDTVGADLVAHCGNDIVVLGAEPLFFLDYLGTSKLERSVMAQLIEGVARGCKDNGCALIGGETAELPSFYHPGEYDLVGAIVGVVERRNIINGENIKPGDTIIGLASFGLHTNGYSLARKIIFDICAYDVRDFVKEFGMTVGEELLKPHKSYVKSILSLISKYTVKGIAHITGGGLIDNVPRILPENCGALIEKNWDVLPIFELLQEKGNVDIMEMHRTFNMGIGMVIIAASEDTDPIVKELENSGEIVYRIGKIVEGNKKVILS